MAGSYEHVAGPNGGWLNIEHLGDAYEAVHEMMWLIQREIGTERAYDLLETHYYPMVRGELEPDEAFKEVEVMMRGST